MQQKGAKLSMVSYINTFVCGKQVISLHFNFVEVYCRKSFKMHKGNENGTHVNMKGIRVVCLFFFLPW